MTSMTSTSVYLAPPKMERPAPKRLLSLQQPSSRPHPYPISSSPLSSPGMGGGGVLGGGGPPKRPGAPRRSHSFCGNGAATTYALASASSCSHLSSDKKHLVAPPLERTLSSIGSSGNFSPFSQQMSRPVPSSSLSPLSPPTTPGLSPLPPSSSPYQKGVPLGDVSPLPSPLVDVPTILIHPSGTPPRPSLAVMRNHSYSNSSRSSSYTSGPRTPGTTLYGNPIEEEQVDKDGSEEQDVDHVDEIMDGVSDLQVA
ncbi:hypothetical protein JCM24511_05972 [Saitozyma sp. JCM 24511]|nr:hypothetical protein JCM24511_05972 [Saitozyma sp. JCM 24511]